MGVILSQYAGARSGGLLAGQESVTVFGHIAAAAAGLAGVGFWQPQVAWVLPASPVGIELLSTSASDGVAGTGARKILVLGVGPGFVSQQEIVTMNGVTPVASALTWQAINAMVVYDDPTGFGSAKTNVGGITARITGAGAIQGFIDVGESVTQHGRYTCPAGYKWLINNFFITGNKVGSPAASYSTNTNTITPNGLVISGLPLTMQNGTIVQIALPITPVLLLEKQTIMFTVENTSIAGMDLSCGATGLLTNNQ